MSRDLHAYARCARWIRRLMGHGGWLRRIAVYAAIPLFAYLFLVAWTMMVVGEQWEARRR